MEKVKVVNFFIEHRYDKWFPSRRILSLDHTWAEKAPSERFIPRHLISQAMGKGHLEKTRDLADHR